MRFIVTFCRSYFQARIILFCSLNIDEQSDIIMQEYTTGWAARAAQNPNDEILKSGVKPVRMTLDLCWALVGLEPCKGIELIL